MRLRIQNYQSISRGEIEVIGLTGIVGRNNVGKTSILRAIRDFIRNTFTTNKILYGQNEGRIRIDDIELIRRGNTSILVRADGVELRKLGGEPIYNLVNLPEFLMIDTDKIHKYLPQFSFQRESLPPFNLNNSQIYYLFSMLYNVERINNVLNRVKTRRREIDREIDYLRGRLDGVLIDIEKINSIMLPNKEKILQLRQLLEHLYEVRSLILRYRELNSRYLQLNDRLQVVNTVDILRVNNLLNKYELLRRYLDRVRRLKNISLNIDIKNLLTIVNYMSIYDEKMNLLNGLDKKIKMIESEYTDTLNRLSKIRVCPECGRELNECDWS